MDYVRLKFRHAGLRAGSEQNGKNAGSSDWPKFVGRSELLRSSDNKII